MGARSGTLREEWNGNLVVQVLGLDDEIQPRALLGVPDRAEKS